MSVILDGTNGVTFPQWTTATRPATPNAGQTGYNTTYGGVEVYNGTTSAWDTISGGPAFSAYQSTGQSLASGTFTKVQFQTKEFDTNSNFDNVTNYRFTPTITGYYQVSGQVQLVNSTTTELAVSIYKNGSSFKYLGDSITPDDRSVGGSALIYLNGSTDYVELWAYSSVAGTIANNSIVTYFQAAFIRGA
jgi:hypothetical protein